MTIGNLNLSPALRTPERCQWLENDDGNYDTHCGHCFILLDGSPSDNNMLFCPYCGRPIAAVETP